MTPGGSSWGIVDALIVPESARVCGCSSTTFGFFCYGIMLLLGEMSLNNEIGSPQNGQTSIVGVAAWFAFTNQVLAVNVILSVFKETDWNLPDMEFFTEV